MFAAPKEPGAYTQTITFNDGVAGNLISKTINIILFNEKPIGLNITLKPLKTNNNNCNYIIK